MTYLCDVLFCRDVHFCCVARVVDVGFVCFRLPVCLCVCFVLHCVAVLCWFGLCLSGLRYVCDVCIFVRCVVVVLCLSIVCYWSVGLFVCLFCFVLCCCFVLA